MLGLDSAGKVTWLALVYQKLELLFLFFDDG